ncbi:DUF6382 domain-containing protein [Cohnella sp.]|uniref:DUF6382 domain-containing protein n=1 Tax=Cohnella sp. TaxID=1883426 RepID=UPI003561F8E0
MIIERDPPITRAEMNETQMQMLKQCDIPGLLPLETEESDGHISLKFLLSSNRMLSEALRITSWSMFDMMGALCRLGEVLEECRLYLLDADRIRLYDEFIFVGNDWHDLRFTYVPIDMPTLHKVDDMERLIIRWMLKVKEPDGHVFQHVLKLVAMKGFMPITLSRYAREYLAGSLEVGISVKAKPQTPAIPAMQTSISREEEQAEFGQEPSKPLRSWDIFRPPTGDPHTVSEMWGDDSRIQREHDHSRISKPNEPNAGSVIDVSRWRTLLLCVGFLAAATGWRFIYLNEPSEQKLLFSICLTLIIGAGILYFWKGLPAWALHRNRSRIRTNLVNKEMGINQVAGSENHEENLKERWSMEPRFPNRLSQPYAQPHENISFHLPHTNDSNNALLPETSWFAAPDDQTTFLDQSHKLRKSTYYLVWENKESANQRIPLEGNSLVIGRSSDASQHVDPTLGMSRAHVELVRIAEEWKVKDLGSRNGSKLNGQPMAPYELYLLQTGDCLTLGHSQYRFLNEV